MKVTPNQTVNAAYLSYYATTACPSCANLGDGSRATPVVNWKEETPAERLVLKERLIRLISDALTVANQVCRFPLSSQFSPRSLISLGEIRRVQRTLYSRQLAIPLADEGEFLTVCRDDSYFLRLTWTIYAISLVTGSESL